VIGYREVLVPASGGYVIPLKFVLANRPHSGICVLILPALGVAARFYLRFANALACRGVSAFLFEQRGHGDSSIKPSRKQDYGFAEWLLEDIPACVDWIKTKIRFQRISIIGHSLGGHVAVCFAAIRPAEVGSLILIACGTPWVGAHDIALNRIGIRLVCWSIPLLSRLLGYFPGKWVRFGGFEARTLMGQWRSLAITNEYLIEGVEEDLALKIEEFSGNILSIRFDEDKLAPRRSVSVLLDKLRLASVSHKLFTSRSLGYRSDHFTWAKKPDQPASLIAEWLAQKTN